GNLAGAVAAAAARNGLRAVVFVPATTDEGKIAGAAAYGATVVRVNGTYDQVNRLCARLADEERWGFVNFTLRPYYAEGSKTLLFECAEQLGWRLPDHVVIPVGSGALLTRTEGVLAEPAGGVVVATAKALAARGAFADDESVVLYITGNAYKGTIERSALGPVVAADADEFRTKYAEALA